MPDTLSPMTLRYDVANLNCGGWRRAGANRARKRFPACSPRPSITPSAAPTSWWARISTRRPSGRPWTNAGYPVSERADPARLRVEVGNLTCGSCVARAEAALTDMPGVTGARVNLATGRADIFGAPEGGFDALSRHMQKAGYPVRPIEDASASAAPGEDDRAEIATYRRAFLIAALLTLSGLHRRDGRTRCFRPSITGLP